MIRRGVILTLFWALCSSITARAEDLPRLAVVGGEIHTMEGKVIPEGTVLIQDGKIRAIRSGKRAPEGYEVIDAAGFRVYPGLIAAAADSMGTFAFGGGREKPLALRVSSVLDPHSREVSLASSHGITTAYVRLQTSVEDEQPFTGTASIVRVIPGGEKEEMVLREPAGILARLDEPARMSSFRSAIRKARKKSSSSAKDKKEKPEDEALRLLVGGEIPLRTSPQYYDQILHDIETVGRHGLDLVLDRSMEAWLLADQLAEREIPVIQFVRAGWFKPREDERSRIKGGWKFDAPWRLHDQGALVAVGPTGGRVSSGGIAGRDLMNLATEAAYAVRGGLTEDEALRAITIDAARVIGMEDRIGSLRKGKDADLIVVDGDPLHYRTFVRTTIAGGRIAYRAEESPHWEKILERRREYLGGSPAWPDTQGR